MKKRDIHNDLRAQRGFSLIEIMVAVTLLAFITVGLLAMFYQTQRAFKVGTSQVDVLENGRAAMQLICRELQQMHTSNSDDVTNFLAEPSGAVMVMNLPKGVQRENMFQDVSFVTRKGDEWTAISYRVDHRDRGAGTLYRGGLMTNMGSVLTAGGIGVGKTIAQEQWRAVSNVTEQVRQRVFGAGRSITNTGTSLVFDRIADGVVHFRVWAYTETGVLYTNNAYVSMNGDMYHMANFVPAYLDVELAILDPKGMVQFNRRGHAEARAYLETQAYRTHLFRQRINLRARRLDHDLFAATK